MEGRISSRRTTDRERREAFIEAFQTHFPEDSTNVDESFDKLFYIIPEALARHNQEEFSKGLGNSATNSNTTITSPRNSLHDLLSPLG